MKIQLCAAQPMHCGVLMRIELTGHLDVNIRWLVDWLESFTGQHAHHVRGEVPGEKGRTASLDVGNCVYVEHEFVYEKFHRVVRGPETRNFMGVKAPLPCSWRCTWR